MNESLCMIEYALRYNPGEKIKVFVRRGKDDPEWMIATVVQDTGHLVILKKDYTFAADKRDIWMGEPIQV